MYSRACSRVMVKQRRRSRKSITREPSTGRGASALPTRRRNLPNSALTAGLLVARLLRRAASASACSRVLKRTQRAVCLTHAAFDRPRRLRAGWRSPSLTIQFALSCSFASGHAKVSCSSFHSMPMGSTITSCGDPYRPQRRSVSSCGSRVVGSSNNPGDIGANRSNFHYRLYQRTLGLLVNACQTFAISRQCEGNVRGLTALVLAGGYSRSA